MVVAEPSGQPAVGAVAGAGPRRNRLVAVVAASVIVLDQATKAWAASALGDGHVVKLVGSLQFRLARNPGAAFSVGSNSNIGPIIAVLAVVVVAVLVVSGTATRYRMGAFSVGLIAGGAVGNVLDRVFRSGSGFLGGHVVDFIDLQWFPNFNVADSAVDIGAVLLVIFFFRNGPTPAD